MLKTAVFGCILIMLVGSLMVPTINADDQYIIDEINQHIDDTTNVILSDLVSIYDDISDVTTALDGLLDLLGEGNFTADNATLYDKLEIIKASIDGLELGSGFDNATIEQRLNQIDDDLIRIEDTLGYSNLDVDNYNLRSDLENIRSGLIYTVGEEDRWLLKNSSGFPSIAIIGENQVALADKMDNNTIALLEEMGYTVTTLEGSTGAAINSATSGIGSTYTLALICVILLLFWIAWSLFLKPRFFPSFGETGGSSYPPPSSMSSNSGRPECFGDSNTFNLQMNPNCPSCSWVNKCEAATVRGQTPSIEVKYDAEGNVAQVYDEGDPVQLPSCFGEEFNMANVDCAECLVNEICAQQLKRNAQQINIPQMPQQPFGQPRQTQQQPSQFAQQAASPESILNDY